jgi:hypothetical protein
MPPLALPAPVETLPLEWTVHRVGDKVFFSLSPQGYENLSRNTADFARWAQEAMYRLEQCRAE